jgi:hypothetical protein
MSLSKLLIFYSLILSSLILWKTAEAQDYDFEIPEEEETAKLEFNGNLDAKWGILRTNTASPIYGLQFFGQNKPDEYLSQYRLDFYLNGDYRYKQVGFTIRTFSQYTKEEPIDLSFFELYGSLNLSPRFTLGVGKRRYNWGKGYAFNPVGYVNAEKDPENPDLALAGKSSLSLNYNRSFSSGLIQNLSLAAIVLPQEAAILDKYSEFDDLSGALKLYLLMNNIDLDFLLYSGQNKTRRYGMDFSTNLRENIELHGEISYSKNEEMSVIQNNAVQINEADGFSYLMGLRYLNTWNMTVIGEYFHNNRGLSKPEYQDYQAYLLDNLNTGDPDLINAARSLMTGSFRSKNLMQDYLYFKASLPEPFELLYSSISVFTIYNVNDNSFLLSPQIGYKPFTNSEILLWPSFFFGDSDSEYGSKQIQNKVEMWLRFYF